LGLFDYLGSNGVDYEGMSHDELQEWTAFNGGHTVVVFSAEANDSSGTSVVNYINDFSIE